MSSISPIDVRQPPLRPKSRRWQVILTRTAFIVAVLLTLLAGFYVVENRRGNAAWEAYQADAQARGVKLTLAEYLPPPVPDERNFAAIPIFEEAFKAPQPFNPLAWPTGDNIKPPPTGTIYKSEGIDLRAWQKFFLEEKMLPMAGENPAADVLKALDRYAPELQQLRLAGQRPDSRFPVNYAAGYAALLPHLQILRSATRLHDLLLTAHLALGDSPAAYGDFRDGFRLCTALENEPTLITAVVRLSMLTMEENAVASGLQRHQWGEAELEKIAADLDRVRLMSNYALALGSERGFDNAVHDQLRQVPSIKMTNMLTMLGNLPNRTATLFILSPSGWLRSSQVRSNRYFDEMLARASQDPPRIFSERPVPDRPVPTVNLLDRVRYALFLILGPALESVEQSFAYSQTLLDETRVGCALERHRLAHGGFPPSLDALVPAFLPGVPQDVMNGAPLHYRLEASGGYTLYSVGWNLRDDGGKFDPKGKVKDQFDWVWSMSGPGAAAAPSAP